MDEPVTDVLFTLEKLDVQTCVDKVTHQACGAISVFIGTTRDLMNGRHVVQLDYECYQEMAEKEVKKICNQTRERWKEIKNIAIHHRLGTVPVKEVSIVIAISSPHRVDALAATQFCIDTLKATVPIWKKEVYNDGTTEWMENKECTWKISKQT
uniref:Molybdopterin synthase catalytic subunit n=1 Tax=Phallusia mammillata TaxID=59560 RepID=A0A6F9DLV1_9ASCI|nr:molybdopterin synthase catalytic subunit [Phallusia mammillata]